MKTSAVVLLAALVPAVALAQGASTDDMNAANNPLTPTITVNFQDYWAPTLYDVDDAYTNSFLFRGLVPLKLGGRGQLLRYTLPVTTVSPGNGSTTGLGDLNLLDLLPFKGGGAELALGPQLTIPTATEDETGTGKWQAGLAALAIKPNAKGILGALLTWQASFAGDEDRGDQNGLTFQPLFIHNLPNGLYLRSTGNWVFDFENDRYVIPLGIGLGKVWARPTGRTVNAFLEPQFSVAHDGAGQPQFQLFAGVNLQFPIGAK